MIGFDIEGGGAPDFVLRLLTEHRLIANATGPETVRLLPPLTLSDADAQDALARMAAALAAHRA
jgi:acetylornithine/succinyldiaminopimelate/putrescine aminotransferase